MKDECRYDPTGVRPVAGADCTPLVRPTTELCRGRSRRLRRTAALLYYRGEAGRLGGFIAGTGREGRMKRCPEAKLTATVQLYSATC